MQTVNFGEIDFEELGFDSGEEIGDVREDKCTCSEVSRFIFCSSNCCCNVSMMISAGMTAKSPWLTAKTSTGMNPRRPVRGKPH